MNPETVHLLNQLNQEFYQTVASSFDETRAAPWAGWFKLLPFIKDVSLNRPLLRVLDLGCGNGRFGAFLADQLDCPIAYTGVDSNPLLLKRAEELLGSKRLAYRLEAADLLGTYAPAEQFEIIVLFGMMHHIPSFERRRKLLEDALGWLAADGLLVVTFWAFFEQERLRQHIVDWNAPEVPDIYRHLDLEEGDFLLDWRRDVRALRYCHYVNEDEYRRLLVGMSLAVSFEADGGNRYVILQRA